MWWLQPIPWRRWSLAALLVVAAFAVELRGPATTSYPFAGETIRAGTRVESAPIIWRDVPEGLLPDVALQGTARSDIAGGTPLTPDRLSTHRLVPADWWVIELPIGRTATIGAEVRIVVQDPMTTISGVLTALPEPDAFGGEPLGAVAVPSDAADLVARAVATRTVVTLVRDGR